jgi:Zn-dependent protease with chaperone function
VHLLLGLSSTLFVMLGAFLTLGILQCVGSWSQRRSIQCLVLAVPIVSLLLGIGGLHHFTGRACLSQAPSWDSLLGVALPLGMGAIAFGALSLGVTRLALMTCMVARSGVLADPELQSFTDDLARRLGSPRCRVLLRVYNRPLAFTSGIFRPTVLLSIWMVEHLDRRELEAVLAHELGHVARRDYLVIWLATVLRDAFFYVPTSWAAYRQLVHEKELACDDAVVGTTHRPLALASALAKVLLHAVEEPQLARFGIAQPLVRMDESVNGRIERLLATPQPATSAFRTSKKNSLRISLLALAGLLMLEIVNFSLMLTLMGCGPALLLGKLF